MLASVIARWMVAIPVAAASFAGALIGMMRLGHHVHAGLAAWDAAECAAATLCAALVGLLIVPHPTGRAARRVFGGVPVVLGMLSLLPGLTGRAPTPGNFAGVVAVLLVGCLVLLAFRRSGTPA